MDYQVFISYRRSTGENLAQLLYYRLTNEGFKVFMDVESLKTGKFNEQLYHVIENCDDFLLLLTKDALTRCENPNDWVRLEIEHALKHNKNIIPILCRDFTFPQDLPESLRSLTLYQGVVSSSEYFDAVIKKISSMLSVQPLSSFQKLLRTVYEASIVYRKAFQHGDQNKINSSTEALTDAVQKLFEYSEIHAFSDKRNALTAAKIVTQYNLYAEEYTKFVIHLHEKKVNDPFLAKNAETQFAAFVELVTLAIEK